MSGETPTKKILILVANPKTTSRLQLDEEVRAIQERLRLTEGQDAFIVESDWTARTSDLQQVLSNIEPQIVHFCGHGLEDAGLAFENDVGQTQRASAATLADLFKLFKSQVECVLLNACYSERQAAAIAKHIPYVVGMKQEIGDQAAISFADGFYGALGAGRSVEDAFAFGCNRIQLEEIPEHLTPILKAKRKAKSAANQQSIAPLKQIEMMPKLDGNNLGHHVEELREQHHHLHQFQALIEDKTKWFVGRTYVFNAIQSFISNNSKGYFMITGDPGQGKSAILAKYVQNTGCVAHFNVQLQGINRADQFLESVCRQLAIRYDLPYDPLPSEVTQDGEFLSQILDEAAQKANGQPIVIAVDALDEVDSPRYRDANILYLPPQLPDGIYFILTGRRVAVPLTVFVPMESLNLLDEQYRADNERDVRIYIQNRINESSTLRQQLDERREPVDGQEESLTDFINKLTEKSKMNFMYLRYILQDIENGLYKDLDLEQFPFGLQEYYEFHWLRMGINSKSLSVEKIKVLYVLAEVHTPVSGKRICDLSGENAYTVQSVLDEWKQFLHYIIDENGEKLYCLYHAAFRNFLYNRSDIFSSDPTALSDVRQRIVEVYLDLVQGDRDDNLEREIEASEQALQVYTSETFPEEWAKTQSILAKAYSERIRGDRADNLEKAIAASESALQVYTRETFPEAWAMTQNSLANAYSYRTRGEQADNLERAITAYEQALQVLTRDAFPEQWATTQNNLAIAYRNRIREERANNLEQAIDAHEQALQVLTRDAFPEQWATTQNNLAVAYRNRIRGKRTDNLERAITSYDLALQVLTRDAFPEQWARIQHNLAIVYRNRIRGERADNLDQAIAASELALQVLTCDAFPEDWAMTQNNLANAYFNRIKGDRANNLEKAIAASESALQVYTRESFPEEWAKIQIVLAKACAERILGDRVENLERAILTCESALQVYTREAFPEEWAKSQIALAEIYSERIRGDYSDNLERAITAYQMALQVYTREAFPEEWARTYITLAGAYSKRIHSNRAENLERTIGAYQMALQVYTREAFPVDWARTQTLLAEAYSERIRDDRSDNLERAISACQSALQVFTREAFPADWVNNQIVLAKAYFKKIRGDRADNLEQAIACYDQALSIQPDFAEVWNHRGIALVELQRYEEAIANYDQAIAIKPDFAEAWNNRGDVLTILRQYEDAIASYDQAIAIQPNLSKAWNSRGVVLAGLERYEEAITSYDRALEIQPDLSGTWDSRGEALDKLGRYEEALSSYDQALQYQPDNAEVWNHRGKALRSLNRLEEAITSFRRAIEFKPHFVWAIANRGQTYQLLRRYEEALQDFSRIIESDSDYDVWAVTQRGESNRLISRHEYEEALQDFNRAIEIDPDPYVWAIAQRGQTLAEMKRYEESRRDYEHVLAISRETGDRKNEAICLRNLGNTYQELDESQQAIECFQESLEISREIGDIQNQAITLNFLGNVYASIEQYSQAIECFQQALSIYRQIGDSHGESLVLVDLADAYQVLDNHQESIGTYEQALAISQQCGDRELEISIQTKFTQALLRVENFERAIAVAQSIPDQEKRLEVLIVVVDEVRRVGGDRAEELLSPLHNHPDARIRKLVNQVLEASLEGSRRITNNLPAALATFVGREYELTALHNILQEEGFAVVTGIGGIGKTEFCKRYVLAQTPNYPGGICWLQANNSSTHIIISQILELIQVQSGLPRDNKSSEPYTLGENSANSRENENVEEYFSNLLEAVVDQDITPEAPGRVMFQAAYWPAECPYDDGIHVGESVFVMGRRGITLLVLRKSYWMWNVWSNENILIILDDVNKYEQVRPYIPPKESQFKIIITTRQTPEELGFLYRLMRGALRENQIINLSGLTAEEALNLLSAFLGERMEHLNRGSISSTSQTSFERETAQAICQWLAFHPLSLHLAGSYLQNHPELSLEEMLFRLQRERIQADTFVQPEASVPYEQLKLTFIEDTITAISVIYSIELTVLQEVVSFGSELLVTLHLSSLPNHDRPNTHFIEIPQSEATGNELNVLLTAPGFQIEGDSAVSLPLDLETNTQENSQTVHFRLTALRPGATTITAEIYRGDTFETTLETTIQVIGLEESTFLDSNIKAEPRPVSQPDLVLQVQTLWNETAATCTFRYQLRSFRAASLLSAGITYQSPPRSSSWLAQVHNLLQTALETVADSLPTDSRSHLISLGQYLFQQLFPTDLQTDLRHLNRHQSLTLLILADQDAQFPWPLLHNGQEFLGERFIIGHWLWDLSNTQPYEFPVGAINLAHYAHIEHPELWATLLEPPGAPPPNILTGGVLDDLAVLDAMRGLHLLRLGQSATDAARQDAPVPLDAAMAEPDLDQKVRPIKLNLRRNRPLVTLSYLRTDQPELTHLQQTWAATFLRARCSAFVGSLWAVNPTTEAAFISSFYHALWSGDSLGGAFHTARRLARATVPDSLDWLAYLLFGDPMARPYRPVPGQGYAVVEPIGQDIADPVAPGTTLRFRVSLRRTPPVWHEERVIEVAETLTFNDLQAHIVTFGLQVTPTTSIPLRPTPSGNYLGWFNLTVPPDLTGDSALVQVYFADGMQTIHTLTFPLILQPAGGQPA